MASKLKGPGRPRKPGAAGPAARMRASRERKRRAGLRLVQSWVSGAHPVYSDHQHLDARSLALHSVVARKLMANPALIEQAREKLRRWKTQHPQPRPAHFDEWERILSRRPEEVAGFLLSMDAEANRLRQSSPFATFLTPEERSKVYAAFR